MDHDRSALFPKKKETILHSSREENWRAPLLFNHHHLVDDLSQARHVEQDELRDRLNHIHFAGVHILVHLRDPRYQESFLVKAYPGPCIGRELTCRWSDESLPVLRLETYEFCNLVIDDGKHLILAPALLQEIDRNCLIIELPHTSYAVSQRKARRYLCNDIMVELHQSGFFAKGKLLDFSPHGFRIRVRPVSPSSFQWFNSDAPAIIHLRHEQEIFFSGLCHCTRQGGDLLEREIVLAPAEEKICRFKKDRIRNPRQHLVPSPTLIFNHPLINTIIQLKVSDISTSGFSVYEKADEGFLMQGMIIPEVTIDFAGSPNMKCVAQVIYRLDEQEEGVRWGLAILDMDITGYSRLTHLLANALDPQAHISSKVDVDVLWEFLFDSGFIYPAKYRLIHSHRKEYRETYRKLYQEGGPEIAKHFTYQENGRILGHVSMVRAYEKAWMVQHHAGRKNEIKQPGLVVLKQIIHYLNDMFRLPSARIDYVMICFRPDNKFPDRVFGGFARDLKDPRGCSMDLFSYLPYTTLSIDTKLPEGWLLKESSKLDLWKLSRFYNHHSGGLLLDALTLGDKDLSEESIEGVYKRLGLTRKLSPYSLTFLGKLNAALIVEHSNLGLNLSELLNGIKILVTNPEGIPWNILSTAIGQLVPLFDTLKVPVLIYPPEYVKSAGIPYEKQYQFWIYRAHVMGHLMQFMDRKFRISYWK